MTPEVEQAIAEIQSAFPNCPVTATAANGGGGYVIVENVPLPGPGIYEQKSTWIGFHITDAYPYADVYPHFVRDDLIRSDGQGLGPAAQAGHSFQGRPAIQLSRRSNRLNPATDTALLKLQKVIQWLCNPI